MLAVPCCRRCGSMDSGGKGAEGACHRVRGALPRVAGCGVGGGGGACPLWTCRPSAAAACDPVVGIVATATQGRRDAVKNIGEQRRTFGRRRWGLLCGGREWGAGEPRGAGSALGGSASRWALAGAGPELSPAVGGGEDRSASPPPVVWVPHSQPFPGQPGGQAWGASGI